MKFKSGWGLTEYTFAFTTDEMINLRKSIESDGEYAKQMIRKMLEVF